MYVLCCLFVWNTIISILFYIVISLLYQIYNKKIIFILTGDKNEHKRAMGRRAERPGGPLPVHVRRVSRRRQSHQLSGTYKYRNWYHSYNKQELIPQILQLVLNVPKIGTKNHAIGTKCTTNIAIMFVQSVPSGCYIRPDTGLS